MNKNLLIAFAITQILLVGSLVVIGSGNTQTSAYDGIDDVCINKCDTCEKECNEYNACNTQCNEDYDGSSSCLQQQNMIKKGDKQCGGSGGYIQRNQQICSRQSSCTSLCQN